VLKACRYVFSTCLLLRCQMSRWWTRPGRTRMVEHDRWLVLKPNKSVMGKKAIAGILGRIKWLTRIGWVEKVSLFFVLTDSYWMECCMEDCFLETFGTMTIHFWPCARGTSSVHDVTLHRSGLTWCQRFPKTLTTSCQCWSWETTSRKRS